MVRLITFLVANAIRPVLVVDPDPPDYMSDDEIEAMAEGFAKLLAGTKPALDASETTVTDFYPHDY
jgi:hypothetical protein